MALGDPDPVCPTLIVVPDEGASFGSLFVLVGTTVDNLRVSNASKDAKLMKGWDLAVELLKGAMKASLFVLDRNSVLDRNGGVEALTEEPGTEIRQYELDTSSLCNNPPYPLSNTVALRAVPRRKLELEAMLLL